MRRSEVKRSRSGDASKLAVGIAVARWHGDITERLLARARAALRAWKVKEANIRVVRVAGSFELPFACQRLIKKYDMDVVVALGCIVKGETQHDEFIAHAVFGALQRLSLEEERPVGLGILTVKNLAQARARLEHGAGATEAALEAALL